MNEFGKRLKFLREKKKTKDPKWTQGFVADVIGVARTTYTAYENGTKQPPLETVNKIVEVLGVSSDYLLGRIDNPSPDLVGQLKSAAEKAKRTTGAAEQVATNDVYIAYLGGPPEQLNEEEAEILREELEKFRAWKEKRQREREKNK